MAKQNQSLTESKPMKVIRELALQFPEVEEGASCVNRAFKARNKSFLFMGMNDSTYDLRLKLKASLNEAVAMAEKSPDRCSVGAHGWVHLTMPHGKSLAKTMLQRWISESFSLLAPKSLVTAVTTPAKP